MRQTKTVVDEQKVGTKGYPRSWKEHGIMPPVTVKEIEVREEHAQEEQEHSEVTP